MVDTELSLKIIDLIVSILLLIIGCVWVLYKIKEYREFKYLIQLDLDANIVQLTLPEDVCSISWDKNGKPQPETKHP